MAHPPPRERTNERTIGAINMLHFFSSTSTIKGASSGDCISALPISVVVPTSRRADEHRKSGGRKEGRGLHQPKIPSKSYTSERLSEVKHAASASASAGFGSVRTSTYTHEVSGRYTAGGRRAASSSFPFRMCVCALDSGWRPTSGGRKEGEISPSFFSVQE